MLTRLSVPVISEKYSGCLDLVLKITKSLEVVDSSLAQFVRSEETVEALFLAFASTENWNSERNSHYAVGLSEASVCWLRSRSLGVVGDSIGLGAAVLLNYRHLTSLHKIKRIFVTGALSMSKGEVVVREVAEMDKKLAAIANQPKTDEEAIIVPHKTIPSAIQQGQRQLWLAGPRLLDIERLNLK